MSNLKLMKTAFNWCSPCYGLKYYTIKAYHMQRCIDNCPLSKSTKASIHNLFSHLDKFAYEIDLIDKMYSGLLIVNAETKESTRSPFTKEQIDMLWKYKDKPNVDSAYNKQRNTLLSHSLLPGLEVGYGNAWHK